MSYIHEPLVKHLVAHICRAEEDILQVHIIIPLMSNLAKADKHARVLQSNPSPMQALLPFCAAELDHNMRQIRSYHTN